MIYFYLEESGYMEIVLAILIVFLVIIILIGITVFMAKKKLSMFLNQYFHTPSLK